MKIVRYKVDNKAEYGLLEGISIHCLSGSPFTRINKRDKYYEPNEVTLLTPCTPTKFIGVGLNYYSHLKVTKTPVPTEPLIFLKPTTAIIGPNENIIYPKSSHEVYFEGELGVIIGKRASNVSEKEALSYVMGYTCVNDLTARDFQLTDKTPTRAKGFDTFAPIGPYIETDLDPGNLSIKTWLNGKLKQDGTTKDLIFSVPFLVSYISHIMTLLPGDVISTGTPAGIGPMLPGDTIEIKIEKIGTLKNKVI
jgi:2-keto-4-pentenoate hydratase/2-oxohepta-3-ene-1,7-dioic acid hydratase in catechol pathway